MHYVTPRSYRMQNTSLPETCPDVLFMETAPGRLELEKWCVVISHRGCTRMHRVTHRSHMMEKLKFGVMCLSALFI
jgi:hypothetical protein